MTFIPAPDCAEAVIQGIYLTKPVVNVLNFWFPGGYTQTDLDSLAAVVDTAVGSAYLAVCASVLQYVNTHVRGLTGLIDLQSDANGAAGFGTLTGTPLPANASLCITLRTGFTGRSARGRFYAFPADDDSLSTGQVFGTSYTNTTVSFLTSLQPAALAIGAHLVVLSRFTGGAARSTCVHTDVTTIVARNQDIDSQRGRLLSGH